MMLANPTNYSSLPAMPHINAMPQGIPGGPWGPLYRSAPGAQIPGVRYPGMRGAGLGASPVQILGFGDSAGSSFVSLLGRVGLAAGTGAAIGLAVHGSRPVLYPALVLGGMSLAAAAVAWALK